MILVQDPPLSQPRSICSGLIIAVLLDIVTITTKKDFFAAGS